ncbi:hypothetical protein DPMN_183509 [Dreissena polymorpha]|uniref:Uncharacterized protein n=1 Tax=Dreissena polymorpha TaxID=45954 RepID=A0A9D4I5I7_DREPO|nr:hypothetical protein DPMN_183509 [Dreissena polymorpha]
MKVLVSILSIRHHPFYSEFCIDSLRIHRVSTVFVRVCTVFLISSSVLIRDGRDTDVFRVMDAKSLNSTVQMLSWPFIIRGLNFARELSSTHTDNQYISKTVAGPNKDVGYTAATRPIPDSSIIPDRHGSTRQFLTSQNCCVGLPEAT